jgi:F-type H+-transporting ATPase subunit delta
VSLANRAVREAAVEAFAGAEEGSLVRVGEDLFALAGLLDNEPRLRKALTDPSVPADAKRALLEDVVGPHLLPAAVSLAARAVELQRLRKRELAPLLDELAEEAMFTEAERAGDLERIEDEVFRFARIYRHESGLRAALTDPLLPPDRKQAVVGALLAGKVGDITLRLVSQLLARGHAHDLDRVLETLADLAAARRDRVVAEVRTAVALSADRRRRLAAALERSIGKAVELHVILDPSVIGSLSVRVGDEVYDGTVRRQLDAAREQLGAA